MVDNNVTAGGSVTAGGAAIFASLIRTIVPLAVGFIVAFLTKLGIPVSDVDVAALVNGIVSAGVALLYYGLVRVLEVFSSSKWGWLLGFAKNPIYVPTDPTVGN